MFCPNCGTKCPDNAKFCPECGKNFDVSKEKTKKSVPLSVLLISIIGLLIIFVLLGVVIYMVMKSDSRESNRNIPPTLCPVSEEEQEQGNYDSEEAYQNKVEDIVSTDEDSVEDLYGSWTDKENLLSLSFLENGDVRISDKTGLIGVELMTYDIAWEGTLEFKAKTDGIFGFLSYEVKYKLVGDTMTIEILGKTFELYRK